MNRFLCVILRYDNALPLALRALEGRQALQGVHPNTARSLYFVGAIHLASKKYRDARRYFDRALEMEETLWSRGMPHSPDWEHLKQRFHRLLVIQGNKQADLRYRKRFKVNNPSCAKRVCVCIGFFYRSVSIRYDCLRLGTDL